jgi:integrase/recombinase XerD
MEVDWMIDIEAKPLDKSTVDLIQLFHVDCFDRELTENTVRMYTMYARHFAEYLKGRDADIFGVDKNTLRLYLNDLRTRKLKHASIVKIFTSISAFYDFLIEEGRMTVNPVPKMRKRYLHRYKEQDESQMRQSISIDEASRLVNSILSTRDRAIMVLLLKTGLRCGELCSLDVNDIDLPEMTIRLKPAAKRSNRILPIDLETADVLGRWLKARETRPRNDKQALFLSSQGERLSASRVNSMVKQYAERVGLHNPDSDRLEDRFSPHYARHFFTTSLIRAGMPRDFVKELRGDVRHEAIDIYNHIDKNELKESYLAHIPQLGI